MQVFKVSELTSDCLKHLLNEATLLAAMRHPHIVKFREAFVTSNQKSVCVVMELLEGGTLSRFIRHQQLKGSHLPEPAIWRFFLQMASAVHHLHCYRVCHRDLKPSNILFTSSGHLKLADFGLSKHMLHQQWSNTVVGTPLYAAPCIYNKQPQGLPADVWALGCITHELATLEPTFKSKTFQELRFKVLGGEVPPIPEQYSQDLRELIAAMLQPDPSCRITMEQLVALPAVASRLRELQQSGLVGSRAPMQQPPGSRAGAAAAVEKAFLPDPWSNLGPTGLDHLAELLPPARYSNETHHTAHSLEGLGRASPTSLFSRGGQRAQPPQLPTSQWQHEAAMVQALSQPSSLPPLQSSFLLASEPSSMPPSQLRLRPLSQRSSFYDSRGMVGQQASWSTASESPIQVHPKYAALVAAAGYAGIQPSTPPKPPASPVPSPKRKLSRLGTNLGPPSPPASLPSPPAARMQPAASGCRISETNADAVRGRRNEAARTMAAAVAANLAREEALLLRQVAFKLRQTNKHALDSPALRRALLAASAVVQQTEEAAAAIRERPKATATTIAPKAADDFLAAAMEGAPAVPALLHPAPAIAVNTQAAFNAHVGSQASPAQVLSVAAIHMESPSAPCTPQPANFGATEAASDDLKQRRWGFGKLMRTMPS